MEFDFRMYDTEENCFMSGSRIIESRINDLYKEGRWIYQLWTGLTDEENKRIYDGDIVYSSVLEKHYLVRWDPYGAMFLFHEPSDKNYISGINYYELEALSGVFGIDVVGNIYETPELLV